MIELQSKIEKCSEIYACRVLFELLDVERLGYVTRSIFLKSFALDSIVQKCGQLVLQKKKEEKKGNMFQPRFITNTFHNIVRFAEGKKKQSSGGNGEEKVVQCFDQMGLQEFLFGRS